ncbi:MAG: lysyl oxidase family protein [Gaiellaceae bacterium]
MATHPGALIAAAVVALGGAADRPPLVVVENDGRIVAIGEGGKRAALAEGTEPALTADGTRLAFVRGSFVHVLERPGGPVRRVATGRSPAWGPDGRLAVASPAGVRVDGRLVAPGASEPAWSRDGRLAVVVAEGIVVDAQVVVPGGRSPAWAPDGRLAYVLGADVYVDGALAVAGARDPAWDASGRLTVVTDAGVLVDGAALRGSRPGDVAPSWGVEAPKPKPDPNLLLPDLDQRAPSRLTIAGWGGSYRLGFTSATDNVGRGPLWVRGARTGNREMRADQLASALKGGIRVFRSVGRIRYVNDSDHHHWHLMRFQQFELRRASDFGLVVRDRKSGFCLGDHYGLARHRVKNFAGPRFFGSCGQFETGRTSIEMGTSIGYTDRYPAHFHGQNVSLTGVPAGVYVLVHRANPTGALRELRDDNNAASVRIRLSWRRGVPSVAVLRTCERSQFC